MKKRLLGGEPAEGGNTKMKKKERRGSIESVNGETAVTPATPATPDANDEQQQSDVSSLFSSGVCRGPRRNSSEGIVAVTTPTSSKIGMVITSAQKTQEKRIAALKKAEEEKKEEERERKEEEKRKKKEEKEQRMKEEKEKKANEEKIQKKENAIATPSSAAETTPKNKSLRKKKKLKKLKLKGQLANGATVAAGAEESDEDEAWPSMRPFVPSQKENNGEHKLLKSDKKRQKREMEERLREQRQKAATAMSSPIVLPPTVSPMMPPSTASQSSSGTVPPSVKKKAEKSKKSGKNVVAKPPVKSEELAAAVPQESPRRSRRQSESSGLQPAAAVTTAVAAAPPPPPPAAATPSVVKQNGRRMRESSPEISSTSSESSDDEEEKKRETKKMTAKPEVTSSKATTKAVPEQAAAVKTPTCSSVAMTASMRMTTLASKEEEVSVVKEKKRAKGGEERVKEGKKEKRKKKEKDSIRPSSDLLRMVAERLANSHGLMVFRLISCETRKIAEEQLRKMDDVLHLEEFDDENAFTRDDMSEWWEQRREAEDTTVGEGKETQSHTQISAYLSMRSVEKRLLTDMDGGLSHPRSAESSVQQSQLLQHPLATLDAACLLHESQTQAASRLLQQGCKDLREVWLGHCKPKLVREVKRLTSIERFEHRQATMETFDKLPLLQITELRLDIVDDSLTREALSDHLVNCKGLIALELNVAPSGPIDGNTASHYALFSRRSYDRANYTDELEWMVPNVEEGDPDPITLCMPSLEHLSTNVANVKLFWQLRDATLLLRHLRSLRVGTLSRTKELITSSELFCDTKESRRYKQQGFFALQDAYETELESVTLRLGDRVGMCGLRKDVATIFESIRELPPSLRRLSLSFFYNQFSGVCAPFRRWVGDEAEPAADIDHICIEEMHLHFERAFDLRGMPLLLPRSLRTLSIAVNYETEDDAKCLGSFLEMLPALERLENLHDLRVQVWGVRCLQPLVAAVAGCKQLAARLTRLAVAAYPVDDSFFEASTAHSWIRSALSSFPLLDSLGLHATLLARLIPEERRSGYSWRNGLAWLANEVLLCDEGATSTQHANTGQFSRVELAAAGALPALDDGEEYTITPHWEVEYDADVLVLGEEEEMGEALQDISFYNSRRGAESSDDDFITDGEDDEEHAGSHDELDAMEQGLEDETERIEKREQRRDEKIRAAIERGEMKEGEEEEEGDVIDFNSISDDEEQEPPRMKSDFVDDEAVESDRVESDEDEGKSEESAEGSCSSEDEDRQREEERMKEEARRQKRMERKQAKIDDEAARRRDKRRLESDEDEEEEEVVIKRRPPKHKRTKMIIDSDDE